MGPAEGPSVLIGPASGTACSEDFGVSVVGAVVFIGKLSHAPNATSSDAAQVNRFARRVTTERIARKQNAVHSRECEKCGSVSIVIHP
jgi:hypothetical protein